jgi:hypothetical protein
MAWSSYPRLRSSIAASATSRDIQPLIDAMAKYGLIDHRIDAGDFPVQ